ncbi:hypothetical protein AYI70_g6598 [Smittium culicis]|uniref:Uncharacterized protein n=1 Tax=Smittium culicis TaxID=133412 RepID=A0A1R1XP97_9FUNG|nr:hypothetical protein AYI70_g6598 [Smittium culicis]
MELPVPSYSQLKSLTYSMIKAYYINMMPIRIPDFLHRLKHNLFPKYFLYAYLSACIDFIKDPKFKNYKDLRIRYSQLAIKEIKTAKDIHNPYIVWAATFIVLFHYKSSRTEKYSEISSNIPYFYSTIYISISIYNNLFFISLIIRSAKSVSID